MAVKPIGGVSTGRLLLRLLGITSAFTLVLGALGWQLFPGYYDGEWLFLGSAAVFLLVILAELPNILGSLLSRRGAVGSNVVLQTLLFTALFVGVNVFSFLHYQRMDWTWDKSFTIPSEIRSQLAQLRGDTDIVVFQKHSLDQPVDPLIEKYYLAARKKIVDKVQDLAELFQDLGPKFKVLVLDPQDDNMSEKLDQVRKEHPALANAISRAPENSIFFHSQGHVQRLAFQDIYQIDMIASQEDNGNRGNLVLTYQGVDGFANKILKIDQKAPKLSSAVIHSMLTMRNPDNPILTMNGAKKSLERYDIDCQDVLLRKLDNFREPAILTYDEGRFELIERKLNRLNEGIPQVEKTLAQVKKLFDLWKNSSLAELNKTYCYLIVRNGQEGVGLRTTIPKLTDAKIDFKVIDVDQDDKDISVRVYENQVRAMENELETANRERNKMMEERAKLNVENLAEKRRVSDIEAKLARILNETDLLIIPRFTHWRVHRRESIRNKEHNLDEAQLRAIKNHIAQGKPALFLLGPSNEPDEGEDVLGKGGEPDSMEKLLEDWGFKLPKQTILYEAEMKDFLEDDESDSFFGGGKETTVPAAGFQYTTNSFLRGKKKESVFPWHPIGVSMDLTRKSVGNVQSKEDKKEDKNESEENKISHTLNVRHPRPVYLDPEKVKANQGGYFLSTPKECWNESKPFPTKDGPPRFQPEGEDDPKKDKKKDPLEAERLGPFPIGAAVELQVPEDWLKEDQKKNPPKARIAVIGHGGLFTGKKLEPIQEKLLLDVSNWLMGRDDSLAKEGHAPWKYPRIQLDAREVNLIRLGAFLIPLLAVYLGILVLVVRNVR